MKKSRLDNDAGGAKTGSKPVTSATIDHGGQRAGEWTVDYSSLRTQ